MALSPKMLAVLRKVDAARAAHFAGLRESAKREAKARAKEQAKASSPRGQGSREGP